MQIKSNNERQHVLVIGGGVAGMDAAINLHLLGYKVTLLEKEERLGGKVRNLYRIFPNFRTANNALMHLHNNIKRTDVTICLQTTIMNVELQGRDFAVQLSNGTSLVADALLLATGYDLFDARKKEEYGYGIYNNVITSSELEAMFCSGKEIRNRSGKRPQRVAFIHCVGSRDEKCGNQYCSSVCCVNAVKQAIVLKEQFLPEAEVYSFYMDMRMYGRYFEDLYREAQEKHRIRYIRGRLSEAAEDADGGVVLKVEDTLLSRPMKLTADLVVLLTGFVPAQSSASLATMLNLQTGRDGFFLYDDEHFKHGALGSSGVFFAGACTGPKSIKATIDDSRSAVIMVHNYLLSLQSRQKINVC